MEEHFFETIDSTNLEAIRTIDGKKCDKGMVISADEQTKGIGRGKNKWESKKGGIYVTFVFKSERIEPGKVVLGSAAVVSEFVKKNLRIRNKIRWPNDIIADGKKISGVLALNYKGFVVIGVGINVNNDIGSGLRKIAVSAKELTRKKYDVEKIRKKFIHYFVKRFEKFVKKENAILKAIEYFNKNNFLKGKKVKIKIGSRKVEGDFLGVDEKGCAVMQMKDSKREKLVDGVVLKF